MTLVRPEVFSGIIDVIYQAASEPSRWQDAIDQLRIMFHGSTACFVRSGPDLQPGDAINANPDPTFQLRYIEEHACFPNIYADALGAAAVGQVYSDRALVGDEALRRSRFWNEWMAPQDMYGGLGSKLMISGPSFWFVDIQRGRNQKEFDAADAELLSLIAPHLLRASDLTRRFHASQALISSYTQLPFGVMLVDAQLRIIDLNRTAEDVLTGHGSPLCARSGTLSAMDAKGTLALQRLVTDACTMRDGVAPGPGGELLLRGSDAEDAETVAVSISPTRTGSNARTAWPALASIYLRRITLQVPEGFEENVRQLFDLTPAEARIAAALASGMALKEAATLHGIRFSTARSYLENIFRKTNTRQQSQLVALLKNTQPLIRRA